MLLNCIQCEKMKLKHSHMWIAFVLIPLLPSVMGTMNYLQNLAVLKSEWFSLWTQETLFYSNFFYAPLIAIYCGYLWRIENRNKNRHLLMTMPVPVRNIFLGKLMSIAKITLFTQLWVFALFFITGKLLSFEGMPPVSVLLYALRGTLGALVIAALQLLLSSIIRSFAAPVAIAIFGAVTGMLMSNSRYGIFYPYSLMVLGMNSNKKDDVLSGSSLSFMFSSTFYLLLFSIIAVHLLKHRDVRT